MYDGNGSADTAPVLDISHIAKGFPGGLRPDPTVTESSDSSHWGPNTTAARQRSIIFGAAGPALQTPCVLPALTAWPERLEAALLLSLTGKTPYANVQQYVC